MGWQGGHNRGQHFYLVNLAFHLMSIETPRFLQGRMPRWPVGPVVQPDVMSALPASLAGIGPSKARSRSIQAASAAFGDKDK